MITLTLTVDLPCGCKFSHSAQRICTDTDKGVATMPETAARLVYWHNHRLPRHRCQLVSESNPNGLARHAHTQLPQQETSGTPATSFGPVSEYDLAR